MSKRTTHPEPTVIRQVFARWSIAIPAGFQETFIADEQYWHAWSVDRSVSLTSVLAVDQQGAPVRAQSLLEQLPAEPGRRIDPPPGLDGWAVDIAQEQPARASRAISGIVAVDGGLLLATVTSDDLAWATRVWRSIRRTDAPVKGQPTSWSRKHARPN